jgi:hypothetical protein
MLNLIPLPYRILGAALLLALITGFSFYKGKEYSDLLHEKEINAALQAKEVAEKKASEITIQTVEKVVYQDRIITKQGAKVTEYIHDTAQVIDAKCELSPESVKALNDAAMEPK